MKIYKAISGVFLLLVFLALTIAGIVFAFMESTAIGVIVLGSAYLFNAITSMAESAVQDLEELRTGRVAIDFINSKQ